ncbi:MAG: ABC transporter permease [SAR324 cluster bacterium]|nr:ABC transporter permease [SAR324 cluster bacterium]
MRKTFFNRPELRHAELDAPRLVPAPGAGNDEADKAAPETTWRRVHLGLGRWIYPLALMAALIVAWEMVVEGFALPRYILPSPSLVGLTLWEKWPIFLAHTWVTFQEVVAGGLLGIVVGIGLALIMFFFLPLEKALYPFLIASQNVPVFAIAPLLVVWFGYGFLPKVLMAAIIVFFPITVSSLDGLKRTDPDLVRLFRTMGATPAQMLWKLRVPAALPALFSGLKISAVYATIGAVIGEWVGAGAGLGYLMLSANAQLRVAEVFGAIICLTPIGLMLLGVVILAERILLPWQRIARESRIGRRFELQP